MRKQLGWYEPKSLGFCSCEVKIRKAEQYAEYTIPVFADDETQTKVDKLEAVKKQFSKDVFCKNRPPETTNFMNACLSCAMRETCKLLFCK